MRRAVFDASDGDSYFQVLGFCAPRYGRKVYTGKGAAGLTRPPLTWRNNRAAGGRVFILGLDPLKSRILGLLASRAPLIRFARSLAGNDYFSQIVSPHSAPGAQPRPSSRHRRREMAAPHWGLNRASATSLNLSE